MRTAVAPPGFTFYAIHVALQPAHDPAQDQRTHPRVVALNLVSFEADSPPAGIAGPVDEPGPREGLGRTRNVSLGGVLLEVARAYPLSAILDLRIALGEAIIAPKARVVRLQELAGDRVEMGLKFVELSPADREVIRGFVQRHPELAG